MLAIYTSRGVTPEVNLRECISCMPPQSSNKAEPTLALNPRGDITRSLKQGYQWPQKWTYVQQKILKKKVYWKFKESLIAIQMVQTLARFIRTICMRRIRWSCEGLTSVHNEYTGYTLKHLLLRHMYNLPLPMLMCYVLKPYALRLPTGRCSLVKYWPATALLLCVANALLLCHTVLCGDLYTACVDASRTVFWDRSHCIHLRIFCMSAYTKMCSQCFNRNCW